MVREDCLYLAELVPVGGGEFQRCLHGVGTVAAKINDAIENGQWGVWGLERVTGVEPATLCLASIRSSQLSYTRVLQGFLHHPLILVNYAGWERARSDRRNRT